MSLEFDLKNHPCLRAGHFGSYKEAEDALRAAHGYLMSENAQLFGYLYQKQVEVNRKLKLELTNLKTETKHHGS